MKEKKNLNLREKAEKLLSRKKLKTGMQLSEVEMQKLIHELEVHQVELELQNEELLLAKASEKSTAEKYQTLYDFAPSGFFALSPDGIILELNLAGTLLLGKERSYLKNKRFSVYISDDSKPDFNQFFEKVFKSGVRESCDIILSNSNKTATYVHISGIATEKKEQCMLTVIDITERKQAEIHLNEFKELFSQFMQHSPVYTFIKEVSETGSRVLQASDNYQEMIGIPGPEMIGKTMEELFPPEFAATINADDWDTVNKGKVLEREEELNNRNYTTIKFPLKMGNKKLLAGYTIDITEQKQAENALTESRDLLHSVIENAPIRVFWKDANLRYLGANSVFAQDAGMSSPKELIGKDDTQMGWSEQAELYRADDQLVIDSGKPRIAYEEPQTTPDGRKILLRTSKVPLRDANSKIIGILGIYDDITDQKQTEEAIIKIKNELKSAMDSMSDAVFISDLDGNFLNFNDAFASFHHIKDKEECFETLKDWQNIIEVYHLDGSVLPPDKWVVNRAINGEIVSGEEYILERKDTGERWYGNYNYSPIRDDNGEIIGSVVVARDVTKSIEAEDALLKSEKRYRDLIDNLGAGVVVHATDTSIILNNEQASSLLGLSSEQLQGKKTIDPDWHFTDEHNNKLLVAEHPVNIILESKKSIKNYIIGVYRSATNDKVWLMVNGYPVTDNSGNITEIVISFIDFTSRKLAIEELDKSEKRLKTILDKSPFPTAVVDTVGENISYWSKSAKRIFGYLPKTSTEWYELAYPDPDYRQEVIDRWKPYMELDSESEEAVNTGEYRIVCKDGSVKICEIFAQIIPDNLIVTFNDITEKKESEKAVKESEDRYRTLLESVSAGIGAYDLKGNVILYNKMAASDMNGVPEDFAGKSIFEIFGADRGAFYFERIQKAAKAIKYLEFEDVVTLPSTKKCFSSRYSKIYNADGAVIGVQIVSHDITNLKIAEKSTKESEARFKALHNASFGGIAIHDKGLILDCNKGLSEITGYELDELIGMDGMLLIAEESRELVMGNVLAEYEKSYEAIGIKKSGEKYPLRLEAKMIPYKGQVARVVEFRDISDQKEVEENLLIASSRNEALLDAIPDIIMEVDNNKVYTWANKEGIEFFGDDVIGKEAAYYFAGEQNTYKTIAPLFKGAKNIVYVESWQRRKDGEKRLLAWQCRALEDENENITGILSSALDITDRKKVEKELKENEIKFRALFEQAGGYCMILDPNTSDGIPVIVDANEAAFLIHGYTKDEFIGRPVSDLENEDGKKMVKKNTGKIMSGKPFYTENVHVRKDGTTLSVAVNAKRIDIGNNRPLIFTTEYDITDRVAAAKALKESEKKYRDLINLAQEGIWVIDKNNITNFANPSMAKMLKYTPEEMVGKSLFAFMDETGVKLANENLERRRAGLREQHDFEFICKNGDRIICAMVTSPILDSSGNYQGAIAGIIDITDRIASEEDAKKNQHLLQQAEEISNQGAWEWDIIGDEWTFSENWLRIHGSQFTCINREELMAIAYHDDIQKVEKAFQDALKGSAPYDLEHRIVRQNDGKVRYVRAIGDFILNDSGTQVKMYGVTQDITEKVDSQKTLKESQERFYLAMNAAQDGLFDWNLVTNEIYYSPGWKIMLGYKDDELANDFSVWEKLTDPDYMEKSWKMQQELINKQRDRFELEFKMKHKDGHWVDIFSRAEAMFDENNKAIRVVGTHVDITERKKAEESIKKLNEELEQKVEERTEKLEGKIKELARINRLFVGRELRMAELKKNIKELEERLTTK